jgi:hypothetical protein
MSILVYLGQEQVYTSGTKTAYPSGAPDFTPRFLVGFVLLDLLDYYSVFKVIVRSLIYGFWLPL